jgi:hypothetical protein
MRTIGDRLKKRKAPETNLLPTLGHHETVVWKKAYFQPNRSTYNRSLPSKECLVKMSLPMNTKVIIGNESEYGGIKCRASQARILGFYDLTGRSLKGWRTAYIHSGFNELFKYVAGAIVAPKEPFDTVKTESCGSGIHFFFSPIDAARY